ncbi:hypothetical protein L933_00615 [Helicobacter pylori PZ5056]|uniref:Uncharacterized protein n=1 Tax=Helicobacter pylori PZ5056 TaxID=1337393 RepID=T2SRN6_HELPX|nr:hypothetical protein L933_00615 [Helicobacter pylori PZ5056]
MKFKNTQNIFHYQKSFFKSKNKAKLVNFCPILLKIQ